MLNDCQTSVLYRLVNYRAYKPYTLVGPTSLVLEPLAIQAPQQPTIYLSIVEVGNIEQGLDRITIVIY